MTWLPTILRTRNNLIWATRYAISSSIGKAYENCRVDHRLPQEPDYVASLVLHGTKVIYHTWHEILRPYGFEVKMAGIYCHQTPKVHYNGMEHNSCEIGDILWCHIHYDNDGYAYRNALLLQAKICLQEPFDILTHEKDQYLLYNRWPEFEYVNMHDLVQKKRRVRPAAPRRGAQFLLIRPFLLTELWSDVSIMNDIQPMGVSISINPLVCHTDLGIELVKTLTSLSGDAFDDKETSSKDTDWSRVIWDLISASSTKAFRRTRSGFDSAPRLTGARLEELDGTHSIPSYSEPIIFREFFDGSIKRENHRDFKKGIWKDTGDPGLSTILIETRSREQ